MASYIKTHKRQGYDDITAYAMAASDYNCGVAGSQRAGGICRNRETQHYVKVIIGYVPKIVKRR